MTLAHNSQIAKHVGCWEGHQLFKGILTASNEHKDIRHQFFLVTDSREQIAPSVHQLNDTIAKYGHPPIKYVFTDKPKEEVSFWESVFPSVAIERERVKAQISSSVLSSHAPSQPELPIMNVDPQSVLTFDAARTINPAVQGIRNIVDAHPTGFKVIGLDAEWTVSRVHGPQGRLDVLSLSYVHSLTSNEEPEIKTLVLHLTKLRTLPERLISLLVDSNFIFVGCNVGGDIAKLARDFEVCIGLLQSCLECQCVCTWSQSTII